MRLTREQIEKMAVAVQSVEADEFYLDVQADGKLTFGQYEVVERKKSIGLTAIKVSDNGAPRQKAEVTA